MPNRGAQHLLTQAGAQLQATEDLNVEYAAGSDSVFVGASLPESEADAYDAVKTTRDEAVAGGERVAGAEFRVGKNPGYFRTAKFIAWTRGRYFFYADASSAAALARFMEAFPY